MKIIKLIKNQTNISEDQIKHFIYKNFPQELINGLEYDDPKTIDRALKLLGLENKSKDAKHEHDHDHEHDDSKAEAHG